MEDNVPTIEFSDDEIANIKASLGLEENEVVLSSSPPLIPTSSTKRGRKGNLQPKLTPVEDSPLPPAPLGKRDEREVNSRLQNMLLGGTGILGNVKPYMAMTDEEAKAIAEPLSSYLVRNADVIPVARQVLENYDLAAITIGVASYVARVYTDRRAEINVGRATHVQANDRLRAVPTLDESASEVRTNGFVSHPDVAGRRTGL